MLCLSGFELSSRWVPLKYGCSFLCVVTRSPYKTNKAANKREGTVRMLLPRGGWGCEFLLLLFVL